jgi:hypothetical protein
MAASRPPSTSCPTATAGWSMNLFPVKPVRFRQILVEEKNGVLNLLPTMPVGSPAPWRARQAQDALLRRAAHPARRCGAARGSPGHARLRFGNRTGDGGRRHGPHLETMRNKHAITLEHLRMGALKGDPRCRRLDVLYNLFDEFEITPKAINFDSATPPTSAKKCMSIPWRTSRRTCKGEFMTACTACVAGVLRRADRPRQGRESLRELAAGRDPA